MQLAVPLGVGTLQWGDTSIDQRLVRGGRIADNDILEIAQLLVQSEITFFDTAEGYGGGRSEERLGWALRQARVPRVEDDDDGAAYNINSGNHKEEAVVATKFLPTLWRFSSSSLVRAARGSAARLGLKPIPLYFIHTPVHYRSVEFWVNACCDAADAGLIRDIGLSNFNASQVERAVVAARARGRAIVANQIMFSLLDYNSPKLQETVAACQKNGITVVAYSPIGQGLLTDGLTREKFSTMRVAKMTRVKFDDLTELRREIKSIADAHGKTMAQVCLQWVISHGHVPLVGCRTVAQAQDILGAVDRKWRLDHAEVTRLDAVALRRSTLESSRLKRAFFTTLFGFVLVVYRFMALFSPSKQRR